MRLRDILAVLEYLDGNGIVVVEDDKHIETVLREQYDFDEDFEDDFCGDIPDLTEG